MYGVSTASKPCPLFSPPPSLFPALIPVPILFSPLLFFFSSFLSFCHFSSLVVPTSLTIFSFSPLFFLFFFSSFCHFSSLVVSTSLTIFSFSYHLFLIFLSSISFHLFFNSSYLFFYSSSYLSIFLISIIILIFFSFFLIFSYLYFLFLFPSSSLLFSFFLRSIPSQC